MTWRPDCIPASAATELVQGDGHFSKKMVKVVIICRLLGLNYIQLSLVSLHCSVLKRMTRMAQAFNRNAARSARSCLTSLICES